MAVHIKVLSDVVCPWCFIGQRTLQKALAPFIEKETTIHTHWEPYIVNPTVPDGGVKLADYYKQWGTPL